MMRFTRRATIPATPPLSVVFTPARACATINNVKEAYYVRNIMAGNK
jgi:hypothetical protein